jgi:hypothetical protein
MTNSRLAFSRERAAATVCRCKQRPSAYHHHSPLLEIARVLVRFDHLAGLVVNANHSLV